MLVWIDFETTGLDFVRDEILEIGMIITADNLTTMAELSTPIKHPNLNSVKQLCSETALKMHEENGLWNELDSGNGVPIERVEEVACTLIEEYVSAFDKPPLAGSTITFDRNFLNRYMPRVAKRLHYRNVDVSSFREMYTRWGIEVPVKSEKHRALADIKESIEHLRYYHSFVREG